MGEQDVLAEALVVQLTSQATDVPDSSVHSSLSWSVTTHGTRPARVGSTSPPTDEPVLQERQCRGDRIVEIDLAVAMRRS